MTPASETTLLKSKDAQRVQSSPPFPAMHWPQSAPVKPVAHLQVKLSTPSTHVPPALASQAAPSPDAHSSMLVSHSVPAKPALHLQVKLLTPSTHVPPGLAWQAAPAPEAHSSMSVSH